jgi:hypothetical protein
MDAEQLLAQIEQSDEKYRDADRECEVQVLAGVHEREAEGPEAQDCERSHGGEARAPARQHRQPDPPANECRGGNRHRDKASCLTRVVSLWAAGLANKDCHVGLQTGQKPWLAGAPRKTVVEPVGRRFRYKCLREGSYLFAKILRELERMEKIAR